MEATLEVVVEEKIKDAGAITRILPRCTWKNLYERTNEQSFTKHNYFLRNCVNCTGYGAYIDENIICECRKYKVFESNYVQGIKNFQKKGA